MTHILQGLEACSIKARDRAAAAVGGKGAGARAHDGRSDGRIGGGGGWAAVGRAVGVEADVAR